MLGHLESSRQSSLESKLESTLESSLESSRESSPGQVESLTRLTYPVNLTLELFYQLCLFGITCSSSSKVLTGFMLICGSELIQIMSTDILLAISLSGKLMFHISSISGNPNINGHSQHICLTFMGS